MTGFLDSLRGELVSAAQREAAAPSRRVGRPWRIALAAAAAAVLAGAIALQPWDEGSDGPRRLQAAPPPPPAGKAAGPGVLLAEGDGPKGEWQLAAYRCRRPRERLLQVVAEGRPATRDASCESVRPRDPRRELTLKATYDRRIGATVVYGLASERVDTVRVRVGRHSLRLPTRPGPKPAPGRPGLPQGVRFYAADVPGDSERGSATGLADGDAVTCAPKPRCDRAPAAGGSGSPGRGDPAERPEPPRGGRRERSPGPAARGAVVLQGPGAWVLRFDSCLVNGQRGVRTALQSPAEDSVQPCSGVHPDWRGFHVHAARVALPSRGSRVFAGFASSEVATVVLYAPGQTLRTEPRQLSGAAVERERLPAVRAWSIELPGRANYDRYVALASDGRELQCIGPGCQPGRPKAETENPRP